MSSNRGQRLSSATHEVISDGQLVQLTAREFDLLCLLAANPGRVFSREYLLDRLWGADYGGFDRTVDTHILRLRKKLGGPGSPSGMVQVAVCAVRSRSGSSQAPCTL